MKINEILTEQDTELYLEYFKNLTGDDFQIEIDEWMSIMETQHTHVQFLTFLKVTDLLGYDKTRDDIKMVSLLQDSIQELSSLADYTLDTHNSQNIRLVGKCRIEKPFGERQKKLLDDIFISIGECEMLYKYFNEKIIN